MIPVIFLMGPTCSGKSTFISYVKSMLERKVHCIEIGKALRAKYPPEYFEGEMAPEKCRVEAMQILKDGLSKGMECAELIIVDGQPRKPNETIEILKMKTIFMDFRFVMLNASVDERRYRIGKRFPLPQLDDPMKSAKDDPVFYAKYQEVVSRQKLAAERINKDMADYFDVWCTLHSQGEYVTCVNTDSPAGTYNRHLLQLICGGTK